MLLVWECHSELAINIVLALESLKNSSELPLHRRHVVIISKPFITHTLLEQRPWRAVLRGADEKQTHFLQAFRKLAQKILTCTPPQLHRASCTTEPGKQSAVCAGSLQERFLIKREINWVPLNSHYVRTVLLEAAFENCFISKSTLISCFYSSGLSKAALQRLLVCLADALPVKAQHVTPSVMSLWLLRRNRAESGRVFMSCKENCFEELRSFLALMRDCWSDAISRRNLPEWSCHHEWVCLQMTSQVYCKRENGHEEVHRMLLEQH